MEWSEQENAYTWKQRGFQIAYTNKVAADVAQRRFSELMGMSKGGISPQEVVDDARPENAILHGLFEWNDGAAGENWRRHQARNALNSIVRVSVTKHERREETVWFSVQLQGQDDDKRERRGYVPLEIVAETPNYYEQALEDARRYIIGFRQRYGQIKELRPLVDALTTAVDQHTFMTTFD